MAVMTEVPKIRWDQRISLNAKIGVATTAGAVYMIIMILVTGYVVYGTSMEHGAMIVELYWRLIPVFVASLLGGILVSRLVVRLLIRKPLLDVVTATGRVAVGDLTSRIVVTSKDEIGILISAFNTMISHLGNLIQSVRDGLQLVSRGNLRLKGNLTTLEKGLDGMVVQASSINVEIDELLARMETITEQVKGNDGLAAVTKRGIYELAGGLRQVAVGITDAQTNMETEKKLVQDITTSLGRMDHITDNLTALLNQFKKDA